MRWTRRMSRRWADANAAVRASGLTLISRSRLVQVEISRSARPSTEFLHRGIVPRRVGTLLHGDGSDAYARSGNDGLFQPGELKTTRIRPPRRRRDRLRSPGL